MQISCMKGKTLPPLSASAVPAERACVDNCRPQMQEPEFRVPASDRVCDRHQNSGEYQVRRESYGALLHTCIISLDCRNANRSADMAKPRRRREDVQRSHVCAVFLYLWPSNRVRRVNVERWSEAWQGSLHAACMPDIIRLDALTQVIAARSAIYSTVIEIHLSGTPPAL